MGESSTWALRYSPGKLGFLRSAARHKADCVTAAWCKRRFQMRCAVDCLLLHRDAFRVAIGIRSVRVDLCLVTAGAQEAERQVEVAAVPIGETSQEPFVTFAPGHDDVFAGT